MLSLCMFPLFLIVGYFLIDKKTQKDILKKIKGNQMVVFGGLILVYFLFVRNNVEGHAVLLSPIPISGGIQAGSSSPSNIPSSFHFIVRYP